MILALDLGSTSFKAGVFDRALNPRGIAARPIRHRYGSGGRVELDPDDVTCTFEQVVQAVIEEAAVAPRSLAALAITSQAQTFTVVDPSGCAKMPFISWQDSRDWKTCWLMRQDPALGDFSQHAGFGWLLPALQISRLAHLQDDQPGFLTPEDRVVGLPGYLVEACTGVAAIDDNLAAMSGLYSLELEDWWPPALEACRLTPRQLSKLIPIGSVAAYTHGGATRFGLPEGVPVVLAGNDQTAGAFGAELDKEGGLLISLGTAQVAYACTEHLPAVKASAIRGPYPGGLHYRMVADSFGGNLVNWARSFLAGCESDAAFFDQVDAAEPGCRGLVFHVRSASKEGSWCNIGLYHTPADFARSVIECLVLRMAARVPILGVDPSTKRSLVAGGGSRSPTWVRLLSEVLSVPLAVTEADPLRGAARMALQQLGEKPP